MYISTSQLVSVCVVGAALVCMRLRARHRRIRKHASHHDDQTTEKDILIPIGQVRSGFANKRGVPRQGQLAPGAIAKIELFKDIISGDALEGLTEYSHAWILFTFSRNSNQESLLKWRSHEHNLFKSKIRPPLLGGKKIGVFASRSPHRPNPIGLTLVQIESVDLAKGTLDVIGIDVCDGTPVIDIKPVVPADIPDFPKYPHWVEFGVQHSYHVEFSPEAENALARGAVKGKEFYQDPRNLRRAISDILRLDVRGIGQNRGKIDSSEIHGVTVDGVHAKFAYTDYDVVTVYELTQT